jgi:hypothetical protein
LFGVHFDFRVWFDEMLIQRVTRNHGVYVVSRLEWQPQRVGQCVGGPTLVVVTPHTDGRWSLCSYMGDERADAINAAYCERVVKQILA